MGASLDVACANPLSKHQCVQCLSFYVSLPDTSDSSQDEICEKCCAKRCEEIRENFEKDV